MRMMCQKCSITPAGSKELYLQRLAGASVCPMLHLWNDENKNPRYSLRPFPHSVNHTHIQSIFQTDPKSNSLPLLLAIYLAEVSAQTHYRSCSQLLLPVYCLLKVLKGSAHGSSGLPQLISCFSTTEVLVCLGLHWVHLFLRLITDDLDL